MTCFPKSGHCSSKQLKTVSSTLIPAGANSASPSSTRKMALRASESVHFAWWTARYVFARFRRFQSPRCPPDCCERNQQPNCQPVVKDLCTSFVTKRRPEHCENHQSKCQGGSSHNNIKYLSISTKNLMNSRKFNTTGAQRHPVRANFPSGTFSQTLQLNVAEDAQSGDANERRRESQQPCANSRSHAGCHRYRCGRYS